MIANRLKRLFRRFASATATRADTTAAANGAVPHQSAGASPLSRKPKPSVDKKSGRPLAALLDAAYMEERNAFIRHCIDRIRAGEALEAVLSGFDAREMDERVAEYSFFSDWLLAKPAGSDLLDVGCVLNNAVVADVLSERIADVWFCNPAKERQVALENRVHYQISPIESAFLDGHQFDLVTCLSTIEHIGYDNSQYGVKEKARFSEPQTQTLTEALERLAALTAPGGHLLVSVPYGFRETLMHPVTHKIASQVFDHDSLSEGARVVEDGGVQTELVVLEASDSGWRRADPRACRARYAVGCPAAGAVAFLVGHRP
jgi:2-polyprenyl-3-methyl-5-hydroxy-6-metoxy-1,4-benzoquinol methylase